MAGPFYCDIGATFVAGQDGSDHTGNEFKSASALMKKINGWGMNALAAGEIVYIKGKDANRAHLGRLVYVETTVDLTTDGWAAGNVLQNSDDDGATKGDTWQGQLVYGGNLFLLMELDDGYDFDDVDDADGIWNDTVSEEMTAVQVVASSCTGVFLSASAVSGTAAGGCSKLIAVDSNWAVRTDDSADAMFELDGDDLAQYCFSDENGKDFIKIKGMIAHDAVSHNIYYSSGSTMWQLEWIYSYNAGGMGINLTGLQYSNLAHFVTVNNAAQGLYRGTYCNYAFGRVAGNGSDGIVAFNINTYYGVLSYENAGRDVHFDKLAVVMINCVVDGSTGESGLEIDADSNFMVLGCRFTNNATGGKFGIEANQPLDNTIYIDYCVFDGNDTDYTATLDVGMHSDDGPVDDGYVNAATDDYNIKSGAEIRSTEVNLFWEA